MARNGAILSRGLRALELLARHAPLDIDGFARLAGLSVADGAIMMGAFEESGYVRRTPGPGLCVPTELALDRMVSHKGSRHLIAAVPRLRYELLEGCGHCPQLEEPARFAALLEAFVGARVPA